MNLPINGLINVKEVIFDSEHQLVVKGFDENQSYEFHFSDVLRVFYYRDRENLTFNQVEDSEKLKEYELKYFEGHPNHRYNHYQFINQKKEKCIEIISKSFELRNIGEK